VGASQRRDQAWFAVQHRTTGRGAGARSSEALRRLAMSNREIFETFPPPGLVLAEARRAK
jgi:hypothetical protein